MKFQSGSLQLSKGWWFLVARVDGKQKWTALHTQDETEAIKRAIATAPVEALAANQAAYLAAQVRKGDDARTELAALRDTRTANTVTWDDLFDRWVSSCRKLTTHADTLDSYRMYVPLLARWATAHGIDAPVALSASQAQAYVWHRETECNCVGRDVALLKRVWRDLRLGHVWLDVLSDSPAKQITRYRRLTVDEVRRVVATARAGKERVRAAGGWFEPGGYDALPDVADLVALGYHTALRRGDLVALTVEDVDGDYLQVVPAKTGKRKAKALSVPLQPEAKRIVDRLSASAVNGCLFTRLADASLGKTLGMTWERSGVADNKFGKATFHSLRATFISAMDDAGIPPHVTDAITGHAPQGMHGRYSQPSRAALMAAVVKAIVPLGVK